MVQAIKFIEEQLPEFIPMGIVHNIETPIEEIVGTAAKFAAMVVIHKPEYVHGDCPECNKAVEKQKALLAAGVDARLTRLDLRVSSCQQDLRDSIRTFTLSKGSKVLPPPAFSAKPFMEIHEISTFPDGRPCYRVWHPERQEAVGLYLLEEAVVYSEN